jgi:hypothetical protein
MLAHVVFFKLQDPTTENAEALQTKLQGLQGQVPQLRHIEVGIDIVRSERSYDVALYTKFDSMDDMQAYQIHPYHQEVLAFVRSVAASVVAVDYETEA